MMGNTGSTGERNPLVALFAGLFGILLATPFGTAFKSNLKATVVFWTGAMISIVIWITVNWKVGVLAFIGFWAIAVLMLVLGVIRANKELKSRRFASLRNDGRPFSGDFPSFGEGGFPSVFGNSSSQRPSHSATAPRHSASTSQAGTGASEYDDSGLYGLGTECDRSASPFEKLTGDPTTLDNGDNRTNDGHTIHQDGFGHTSSSSDSSSTRSSDGGSPSSSTTDTGSSASSDGGSTSV